MLEKIEETEENTIFSNSLINALRHLPFERRFIYLLRTKGNFSYRDLETITIRHRDEISLFLTETREFLRILLNKELSLPFAINSNLCPVTYKYLSPYLDNELNALNIMEVERHLSECDTCLQILANLQYIHKQVNNLHLITQDELLSCFWKETNAVKKGTSSTESKNKEQKQPNKKLPRFLNFIRKLFNKQK